ncbi:MAG: plastocyanin/azurin family copper-binding protein [Patescibacteria group bacterium]
MKFLKLGGMLALLVLITTLISGCGLTYTTQPVNSNTANSNSVSTSPVSISIQDYSFNPATVTVKTGTTVTWTNKDSVSHPVKADGIWDSGPLGKDQSFSRTFSQAGTFNYYCSAHPRMKGTIIVKD